MCRAISSIMSLVTLAVMGVLLWYFLGQPQSFDEAIQSGQDLINQFGDILDNFDWGDFDFGGMIENEGIFSGGDNTTLTWDLKSTNGLYLLLKNNLDDSWQNEFSTAVYNWMDSNPMILRLDTERIADWQSNKCKAEGGLQVVCNGNSGDNGMLGFNNLVFDSKGVIFSSEAWMNEYYLGNAGWDERLYTMCHELGHGFGLPHTDENPYNKDTYNCMDYAKNPSNNILPGEVNFIKLKELYGTVSRRLRGGGNSQDGETTPKSGVAFPAKLQMSYDDAMVELEREVGEERRRNRDLLDRQSPSKTSPNDDYSGSSSSSSRWRNLHRNDKGGRYVRDLVDGYRIEANVLYPRE